MGVWVILADRTEQSTLDLLCAARRAVLAGDHRDQQLAEAAAHLITCAVEVVSLLPAPDADAAREALASARAAVTTATYAVQRIDDASRGARG